MDNLLKVLFFLALYYAAVYTFNNVNPWVGILAAIFITYFAFKQFKTDSI